MIVTLTSMLGNLTAEEAEAALTRYEGVCAEASGAGLDIVTRLCDV